MTQHALLPVVGRCNCPKRSEKLALRIVGETAALIQKCLRPHGLNPDLPYQTSKCSHCGGIIVLTIRDLYMVA